MGITTCKPKQCANWYEFPIRDTDGNKKKSSYLIN